MSIPTIFNEIITKHSFPIIINYNNDSRYSVFTTKNGQSWNRKSSRYSKKYKMVAVPNNLNITEDSWRYTKYTQEEMNIVNRLVKENFKAGKGRSICGIIILGERKEAFNIRKLFSNSVIKEIQTRDKNMCILCGSKQNCQIDHKDDLYETNNKELTADDGQLLCPHCNVTKRGGNSSTRYLRTAPPFLEKISKEVDKKIYFWRDPRKWIDEVVYKLKSLRKKISDLEQQIECKDSIILTLKSDIERYERLKNKNDLKIF